MKILGFDTSTSACSAALLVDDQIYTQFQIAPRKHAELVLGFVQTLLDESGISLSDLDVIAFGQGPGSFMGNRIATGVAQGLAFGVDKPLVGVSTLQTLAQTAYLFHEHTQVLAGWDARMHGIYTGCYELDANDIMQCVEEEKLVAPEDIVINRANHWTAVGNAWDEYADDLPANFYKAMRDIQPDVFPRSHALVQIARHKCSRGETIVAEAAEPVYLRDTVTN